MINYKPTEWLKAIFQFHKSDTFRKLIPFLLLMCLYSYGVAYMEITWLHLSKDSYVKNTPVMHSLLGFAISMLLVFRTNTAYDRWWEGRKLWGNLINNSRNLAIKLNSMLPNNDTQTRLFFRTLIPRFAVELKKHLQDEKTRLELDEQPHPEITNFDNSKHVPNQVASLMMEKLSMLYTTKKIDGNQLIILNAEMQSFLDICGACERIKNTPIPYSYSSFIKKFIFFYTVTLPFGFVFTLGYFTIPVVAFIFYVLASLELIAEEIEDPFGKDDNDLPMQKLCATIQKNIDELI